MKKGKFLLKLTEKESEEFDYLRDKLLYELDISPKRLSEIIFHGFKQYAENLLVSYDEDTTQTFFRSKNVQISTLQRRKQYISELLEEIKERGGYININDLIGIFFFDNNLFKDLDIRVAVDWLKKILCSDRIVILNLTKGIYLIHKESKWYPQFRRISFKLKDSFYVEKNRHVTFENMKNKLLSRILKQAPKNIVPDRAEKTILARFLYETGYITDKPMIDNSDINMMEVIRLRSEYLFSEAEEILKREREEEESKKQEEFDEGLVFLKKLEEEV